MTLKIPGAVYPVSSFMHYIYVALVASRMKPSFEYVELGTGTSIKVKTYIRKKLRVPFHYHPEHEIVLVLKGSGKVIVADSATSYEEGELFFIGGNIPHLFVDDNFEEDNGPSANSSKVVVIQFKEDLFSNMLHLPEFYHASVFLAKTRYGIKVGTANSLKNKIMGLMHAEGIEKFNTLSYLFDQIERNHDYRLICQAINGSNSLGVPERIRQIRSFISANYSLPITVEQAAKAAHLSKTSFCRFLKKATQKTFSEHLNEIRIESACKLLRESSSTITQICYEVGFNNMSYFYRQFRKLRKLSPHEYQQQMMNDEW